MIHKTGDITATDQVEMMGQTTERTTGIALPIREFNVNAYLVDVRGIGKKVKQFFGVMKLPTLLMMQGGETVNWRFDELKEPLKGVTMDTQNGELSIVFTCMTSEDSQEFEKINGIEEGGMKVNDPRYSNNGKRVEFDELSNIFKMYDPSLAEIIGGRNE